MKRLNFPNTCPKIDKALSDLKNGIYDELHELIFANFSGDTECIRLKNQYTDIIYEMCADLFEQIRTLNSDMREQAEHQLAIAEEEIGSLQQRIKNLEEQLENENS